MEKEPQNKGEVKQVITNITRVYENGEYTEFTLIKDKDSKKGITKYRETQLVSQPWKPKSHFSKMYTGGRNKTIIPQFEPKGFAQYYLNTIPLLKQEENCLGDYDELGKWYNYSKEDYRRVLDIKRNTFDRFMQFCIENNILSIYGRNDNTAIYLNPRYFFNGRQLHINLCLAFDHDDSFIKGLTEVAREEYLNKRVQLESNQELGGIISS